jgi:hypothetical protein
MMELILVEFGLAVNYVGSHWIRFISELKAVTLLGGRFKG